MYPFSDFLSQHFSTLITRWKQSFRPPPDSHTWLFGLPNLITYSHISPFTWAQSDMLPVCIYSTSPSKKKKEKNLITWLTECPDSMSCGCELGWKRNIHKLKLSINSLTVWDTTLWMSERNSLLDENIAVYLLDQVFPGIWPSIRGREGGIKMWSPSGCAEHL